MRIFFSVGEPSGDLHGANLIEDLKRRAPDLECVGFGGPKMADRGCHLLFDLTSLAVMGLWNVLLNLRQFFRLLASADRYFQENQVDAVVLVDYPGFNWWIARKARKHNIQVFYYGVPQMWAWAPWRVHKLRRLIDHVICKLPFEVDWFQRRGCAATYVGHPYFDELIRYQYDEEFITRYSGAANHPQRGPQLSGQGRMGDERPRLVLLPGSRTQEVARNLPWLLQSASRVTRSHPGTRVAVACFRDTHRVIAEEFVRQSGVAADVFVQKTPELILMADACIACSGSVSLELLYHRKPTVIVYRINPVVMLLQHVLLRTRFITLVNMLTAKRIEKSQSPRYDPNDRNSPVPMPEYLRCRNCSHQVAGWIQRWWSRPDERQAKIRQLDDLARRFAQPGASNRAAEFVISNLRSSRPVQADESKGPTESHVNPARAA